MKSLRYLLQALLATAPAYGFPVEPTRIACPTVVPAAAIQVTQSPAGWVARPSWDFRLSSAGFNNGPPEKLADLKPDTVVDKGKRSVETWQFDKDEFADGLWLVCGYGGAAGEITLAKRMQAGYSSCSVSYGPSPKAGSRTIEIACR
ncbi:STY0301 family protein [Duganella rivi]|uniref:STY0301 family protein n=1 Tax=Duganella rivi TaxID=2666083 RepID=UPI003530EF88